VAVATVQLRTFARLKLRLLGNSLRSSVRRAVMFALSAVFGVIGGLYGFGTLVSAGPSRHGEVFSEMIGAVLVIGWVVLPLLFFGVDETVDPARFALLPISRPRLIAGQVVTALIGIPATATAVALLGFVLGSTRLGLLPAAAALVGATLTLLFGITASRAVTSAFAVSLRSRKAKDLASVVIALLGASVGPLEAIGFTALGTAHSAAANRVVDVLAWTPAAAGIAAPYDLAAGRPLVAWSRLVLLLAAVGLAVALWLGTLESAMIGVTGTGRRRRTSVDSRGYVDRLLPRLFRVRRPGLMTGIVGRDLRYWRRDPRRRAALLTVLVVVTVFPLMQLLLSSPRTGSLPTWVLTGLMGIMVGPLLINTFSFDGAAYGLHVLVDVPPRTEIAARVIAYLLALLPVYVIVNVVLALVAGDIRRVPEAIGALIATTGVGLGTAVALSVPAAYPMPETRNMLAMNTGTGSERGLLAVLAISIAGILSVPVFIAAHLYGWNHGWAYAAVGLLWGIAGVVLGGLFGAAALRRRGPDRLLAQITPRP
jgi:ABC-2 type transport system permease protein